MQDFAAMACKAEHEKSTKTHNLARQMSTAEEAT